MLGHMDGSAAVANAQSSQTSRPVRALRGTAGSLIAALFAAASHALAGGSITWLSVVVTAVLALPLCVLLAGRIASLWRLTVAVGGAQFLYHWIFSGVGASTGGMTDPAAVSPHAAHLGVLQAFTPATSAAGAQAGTAMWLSHALAAAITIALIYRGERAFVALLQIVRRAVPLPSVMAARLTFELANVVLPRIAAAAPLTALRDRLLSAAAITHRGPPLHA